MKSINQIFKNDKSLLYNEAVRELVEYCQELEGEIYEIKQTKQFSFENKLTILVQEVYADIKTFFNDEIEHKRFNEIPEPNWREGFVNLKKYFEDFSRDNNFNLR